VVTTSEMDDDKTGGTNIVRDATTAAATVTTMI
jgi:hypothetical protein